MGRDVQKNISKMFVDVYVSSGSHSKKNSLEELENKKEILCKKEKVGYLMKKVLMIGPGRNVNGGISAVVNNYYAYGLDSKAEVRYISTMEDGTKWHKLLVAIKAFFLYIGCVRNCDIVHIHMASDVSLCRKIIFIWLARWKKKKIIIHQHGGNIEEFYCKQCNIFMQKFIKRTLRNADKFLVIAPYLAEFFSRIVEEDKIIIFPNGVPIPEITQKDYSAGKILFLGRLCKEKGIGELLEACEKLYQENYHFQLYLGGIWEDKSLKEKAEKYGAWLHQLGWVAQKEKDKYLRECNIFALPSYFEGQSVSLLEAMSYKCACTATDIGGIPQMLLHEETGLFCTIKDSVSLKQQLERYLQDVSLQEKLAEAAAKKIQEDFNIEKNMVKLFEIYESILR